MRLIKVTTPETKTDAVINLAFSVGIERVTKSKIEQFRAAGETETRDAIDIETSTPKAKRFIDALLATDFYDRENFSVSTRQPRSIISGENWRELTVPVVEPATDIFEELWQFSQITRSFAGRFLIGGCLLAFGLIQGQILLMIAGLLFLPLLPLLLAIGFGSLTKYWQLAAQGAKAFTLAAFLLLCSGSLVAVFSQPPIKYDDFNSPLAGFFISLIVGAAAALANTDDAGKRELIGLAATAQLAIIPVWFGICFVFGFTATTSRSEIFNHGISFFINGAAIVLASTTIYVLLGAASSALKNLKSR